MNVGLFGGTFNPIHYGHLLMAEAARERFKLDRVIFIPAGHPPHKADPNVSAAHRLRMVRDALRGNPRFSVSDWEVRQKRVVYTYETLAYFRKSRPRDRFYFILGSDSVRELPRWRESASMRKQCVFLAIERPGQTSGALPAALRRVVKKVPSYAIPFSSREIRAQVRTGKSIRYQVPESVRRYIESRGLYQAS